MKNDLLTHYDMKNTRKCTREQLVKKWGPIKCLINYLDLQLLWGHLKPAEKPQTSCNCRNLYGGVVANVTKLMSENGGQLCKAQVISAIGAIGADISF